ncbi:MAG: hypothetical protein ACERKV_04730 [Clostridiaceae bacterium]
MENKDALVSTENDSLKKDLAEIKDSISNMSSLDEKLDSKMSLLENKINSTNKWIITLSIIAIICVTALSFVVVITK